MGKKVDLTGKTFGLLTVVRDSGKRNGGGVCFGSVYVSAVTYVIFRLFNYNEEKQRHVAVFGI
jgi:hypothetical protein